jgi:hypothetical protein
MGCGYITILQPHRKLDVNAFRHPDVFQSYYSEEVDEWMHDQRDGLLLWRSVLTGMKASKPAEAKYED